MNSSVSFFFYRNKSYNENKIKLWHMYTVCQLLIKKKQSRQACTNEFPKDNVDVINGQ